MVYDSYGTQKINLRYYSSSSDNHEYYHVDSKTLTPGNYTIKIINCYDGYVMDTANLYVVSVPYSAYSFYVYFSF